MTLTKLLQKLLRFKSITPSDGGAFDFIDEYLGSSWTCINIDKEDVKNRFYYKKFGESQKHLCFAGHVDVVPTGDGWSVDPFDANLQDDGIIIARGAQDMKSGVAAFLYSCKHFDDEFDGTLSILLTSDEEGDAKFGTVVALEHLKEIDFLPKYSIIAEPTCEKKMGDTIKIGRRGSINGYIEVQGKQGHAAYPQLSINPIGLISGILSKLNNHFFDNGDDDFKPSQLVLTDLRSGMQVTNVTPDKLNIMFNVRNSTKTTQNDIELFIKNTFKDIPYTLRLTQGSYPFVTNTKSLIVKLLQENIEKTIKIKPVLNTAGGTSDARFMAAFGVEVVEFGVENNSIHAIDEKVKVKDVQSLSEVFDGVIRQYLLA